MKCNWWIFADAASSEGLLRPPLDGPQAVIKLGQRAAKATEDLAAKIIGEVGQKLHAVPKITSKNIPVWVHSRIKKQEVKQDEGRRSHETHDTTSDSRHRTRTVEESQIGVISDSSVADQSPDDDGCLNFSETVSTVDRSETCLSPEQTTFKSDFNLKEKSYISEGTDAVSEVSKTMSISDAELPVNRSLETKDLTATKDISSNINSNEIVYSRIRKPLKRRSSGRRSKTTNRKISFRILVRIK